MNNGFSRDFFCKVEQNREREEEEESSYELLKFTHLTHFLFLYKVDAGWRESGRQVCSSSGTHSSWGTTYSGILRYLNVLLECGASATKSSPGFYFPHRVDDVGNVQSVNTQRILRVSSSERKSVCCFYSHPGYSGYHALNTPRLLLKSVSYFCYRLRKKLNTKWDPQRTKFTWFILMMCTTLIREKKR